MGSFYTKWLQANDYFRDLFKCKDSAQTGFSGAAFILSAHLPDATLNGFLCTCNCTFLFPGIREWDSCQEVVLEEWSLFPWAVGVSQLSTCQVSELLWVEWGLLGGTEFRVTSFIYGALTGCVFSINIKDPWSCGTSKSNCDLTCFSIRES